MRALFCLLVLVCWGLVCGVASNPVVHTSCGAVEGRVLEAALPDLAAVGVDGFFSIPFGADPSGAGRWKEPAAAECWSGTLNASAFGPMCPQEVFMPFPLPQSEDCLSLSVFRRSGSAVTGKDRPVFVFIYGGGLMAGSGAAYGAVFNLLAAWDAVVVVPQYRVGALGFLALSDFASETGGSAGNYGFWDQMEALRWIQRNVADFGGDAHNVTVFGQSSGGTSVFALLSSPIVHAEHLIHAAISLSGSPNFSTPLSTAMQKHEAFVSATTCKGHAAGKERAACLRGLKVEEVIAATPISWYGPADTLLPPQNTPNGFDWAPVAIVDGKLVQFPLLEALEKAVVDVPLLVQWLGQEDDVSPRADIAKQDAKQWNDTIASYAPHYPASFLENLKSTYPIDTSAPYPALFAYNSLTADQQMGIGSTIVAATAAKAFKSPVYLANVRVPPANSSGFPLEPSSFSKLSKFQRSKLKTTSPPTPPPSTPHPTPSTPSSTTPPLRATESFHMWDIIRATATDSLFGTPYLPLQHDKDLGTLIRASWNLFHSPLIPIQDPKHPTTNLFTHKNESVAIQHKQDFRAEHYAVFQQANLAGPEYWWAN